MLNVPALSRRRLKLCNAFQFSKPALKGRYLLTKTRVFRSQVINFALLPNY